MADTKHRTTRRSISAEHKAALVKGRDEGRAVRRYLQGLEAARPRRGRRRTTTTIEKRLRAIDEQLGQANAFTRLHLIEEKKDLEAELKRSQDRSDLAKLEKEFIKVARSYSERKGISYGTWRAVGVPASVLSAAGLRRTRG